MKKYFILTTFIYVNNCFNQSAVMDNNHKLIEFKFGKYQFKTSDCIISRFFTQKEVNKIKRYKSDV